MPIPSLPLRRFVRSLVLSSLLAGAPFLPAAETTGTLSGSVWNAGTHAYLEGARVRIDALQREALTDGQGGYAFAAVPPGDYTIVASYIGLDPLERRVHLDASGAVRADFELGSSVYQLEQFVVASEREGNAASLTRQRNATNLKNVVALDAYGNLPNENAGDLLQRLAGVAGMTDDYGQVTGVAIRGIDPTLNTFTVDGNLQSSSGGFSRDYRTNSLPGAAFEEVELVKSPTPDMAADSLGGNVNLKTRSALSLREKRRISYRAGVRYAPPFTTNTPRREDHRAQPLLNFGYQERFSVLGGHNNLGVTLNAFYSEYANGSDKLYFDYQRTTASPAYLWDYRTIDSYDNDKRKVVSLRFDYQLSPQTKLYLSGIYNDAYSWANKIFQTRAYTSLAVATIGANGQPTGTGAILPDYTDTVTRVRNVAAARFQLTSTEYSFFTRERQIQVGGEHDLGFLLLDANLSYNQNHGNLGNGRRDGTAGGGIFTMDVASVGWTIDRTDAVHPTFTQTSGPSLYDGANYGNGLQTIRDNKRNTEVWNAGANARITLPFTLPTSLKTGYKYRRQRVAEIGGDRRWNYAGTAARSTFADPNLVTADERRTGRSLPFVDPATITTAIAENPAAWKEDVYYGATRTFIGTRHVTEEINAGYLQAQTKVSRLTLLGGVRFEQTDVEGFGYLASRVQTSTTQRTADPIGSALADYNHPQSITGDYGKWFPGLHAVLDLGRGLRARASWSNSIGRPAFTNFVPAQTASTTAQTLTINNAGLKPQTSENIDAGLEYYFEPVGQVSIGYFHKRVQDFLVTGTIGTVGTGPDNGYNGDYEGYSLVSTFNGGQATIEGWEFNYQQQFTFLPGLLKGLGGFANYTTLRTRGDYGGSQRSSNQLAGFVPETANVGLNFRYRSLSTRVMWNYRGSYLATYATDPSQLFYACSRGVLNVSAEYRLTRSATLFCELPNVTREPQQWYRYAKDRIGQYTDAGFAITFGVSGVF